MTNKEYMTAYLEDLEISEGGIEIMMLDEGIDPNISAEPHKCKMAVYNRFTMILKSSGSNKTEGGQATKWNMEAIKLFYSALCDELGIEKSGLLRPKMRNLSNYW